MWNECPNATIKTSKKYKKHKFENIGLFETAVSLELGISENQAKKVINIMKDLDLKGRTSDFDDEFYFYPVL